MTKAQRSARKISMVTSILTSVVVELPRTSLRSKLVSPVQMQVLQPPPQARKARQTLSWKTCWLLKQSTKRPQWLMSQPAQSTMALRARVIPRARLRKPKHPRTQPSPRASQLLRKLRPKTQMPRPTVKPMKRWPRSESEFSKFFLPVKMILYLFYAFQFLSLSFCFLLFILMPVSS